MHKHVHRRKIRRLAMASLLLLLMQTFTARAAAEDSQPERQVPLIPSRPVEAVEIVQEIARQAEGINDPDERFRILSSALYHLDPVSPRQRRPVTDALEETARHAEPQTLISSRESLIRYAPELAVRIALRSQDQRLRDAYFGDLVPRFAADEPKRALELLELIESPEWRGGAILGYIKAAPVPYEQVEPLLKEAMELDWQGIYLGSRTHHMTEAVSRFAKEHSTEISELLRKHLEPEDAIPALVRLAWILSHRLDAPQAAQALVEGAKELIPQTKEPSESAISVIRGGSDQLRAAEAKRLFDKFILPAIERGDEGTTYPLALLANVEMPLLVSRAKAVAKARSKPLIDVLPKAVGRAAHESDPERVLAWLKSQSPSPLRGRSVVKAASILQFRLSIGNVPEETARRWLETLSDLAADIEDDRTKWVAYHILLTIAKDIDAPLDGLRQEWWTLWQRLEQEAEPQHRGQLFAHDFYKFPLEEQQRRLAERLDPASENYWKHDEHPPWLMLERIGYSSLPDEKKERLYRQMARQAQDDPKSDPMTVAAIAGALAAYDYPQALQLMWKALPEPRKRGTLQDTFPPLESPQNATTALQWLRGGRDQYLRRGKGGKVVEALWSLAHAVPESDRDAVLKELTGVLLEQGKLEQALGIAGEVGKLPVRLALMAEIAGRAAQKE